MRLDEEQMQEEQKGVTAKVENLIYKSSHLPMRLASETVIYNTIHARKTSSTESIPNFAVSKVRPLARLGLEVVEVEAAPAALDELAPAPKVFEGPDELEEFEELDELSGATAPVMTVAGRAAFPTNKACTTAKAFICCPRPVSPSEVAVTH